MVAKGRRNNVKLTSLMNMVTRVQAHVSLKGGELSGQPDVGFR